MKEISKQGGPRATRRSDREATRVKRKPKRMSYARRRGIAGIALLVGLLLIGVALIDYLAGGDDEIGRGVRIGSVDVGGMSREEARQAVAERRLRDLPEDLLRHRRRGVLRGRRRPRRERERGLGGR